MAVWLYDNFFRRVENQLEKRGNISAYDAYHQEMLYPRLNCKRKWHYTSVIVLALFI